MANYVAAPSAESGTVYPLDDGYDFHSASCEPTDTDGTSALGGSWLTKLWVPEGKVIGRVGTVVTTAAVGAATLAGFAIYSEDGTERLGSTPHDGTLFTSTGLREKDLSADIAATAGRFVLVLFTQNHATSGPSAGFKVAANSDMLNFNGRRSQFGSAQSSYPSTVNPATYGTATEFLPFIALGE